MSDITSYLPYLLEQAIATESILELGTRGGSSTSVLLLSRVEAQRGKVISVDIDPECSRQVAERLGPLTKYWQFIHGDSTDSSVIEQIKLQGPFGLIFVDSSHEASQTTIELNEYSQMVLPGGKMIFHDTEEENIYWNAGVRKPLFNFLSTHPEFILERDVSFSHGMTTIRKQ